MGKLANSPLFGSLMMPVAMAIVSAHWLFDRRRWPIGALILFVGILGFANDWLWRRGYRSWAWISSIIGLAASAVLLMIFGFGLYSYL